MGNGEAAGNPAEGAFPRGRWLFAIALLIVEYLLAIFVFDSERLPIADDAEIFAYLGDAMPLIFVVMTATFIIGSSSSQETLGEISGALRVKHDMWPWLVAHVLAYAVALGITIFKFNADVELESPWLWVVLWAGSAISSAFLWVAALIPTAAVRSLAGPVSRALGSGLFVGLIALAAGYATAFLWEPMSRWTLQVVAFLLKLSGETVVSDLSKLTVGTPDYYVFVDRPCSGYEGIGLITVMLSFYLFYFRHTLRLPNALALLPIGVAFIWLSNSLRIAALILVGAHLSPDVAEGGFHSAAGWLLFCMVTLALVSVSRRSSWFTSEPTESDGLRRTPEGAYLLPLLTLLAAGLVTGLFTADFDYLYPVRIIATLVPVWFHRRFYDFSFSWSWRAVGIGLLVALMWIASAPVAETDGAQPGDLAQMGSAAAAFWLFFRILGSVIVVPFVEEVAFRGYLLRRLISADFTKVSGSRFTASSFLVSSLVFGLLHERWIAGILAGMLYAAAQYRRGRVEDAITAHATTNALLAAYVLAFDEWSLW